MGSYAPDGAEVPLLRGCCDCLVTHPQNCPFCFGFLCFFLNPLIKIRSKPFSDTKAELGLRELRPPPGWSRWQTAAGLP